MAVVTVKSQPITDQDASPRVSPQSGTGGKYRVDEIDSFASLANGDSIGSKYIIARIPSTVRVKDMQLEVPTGITTAIADIGLYHASGGADVAQGVAAGAVIDADFFASAQTLVTAGNFNVVNESGTYLASLRDNPIWEAVGLAADPGGKFDIVLTLTAAAGSAGLVYLKVGYAE